MLEIQHLEKETQIFNITKYINSNTKLLGITKVTEHTKIDQYYSRTSLNTKWNFLKVKG